MEEFKTLYKDNVEYWSFSEEEKELHFTMTLTSPALKKAFHTYGKEVFGLDAVYKYTDKRIPVWVIVVHSPLGHIKVGYIISTRGTKVEIQAALAPLLITTTQEEEFKPKVMIDHDKAECAAIRKLGVCSFLFFLSYCRSLALII